MQGILNKMGGHKMMEPPVSKNDAGTSLSLLVNFINHLARLVSIYRGRGRSSPEHNVTTSSKLHNGPLSNFSAPNITRILLFTRQFYVSPTPDPYQAQLPLQ